MARAHGRLYCSLWDDADWRALNIDAQWCYEMLLSQKKLSLAGVIDYMPNRWELYAANVERIDVETAVERLEAASWVVVDRDTLELAMPRLPVEDVERLTRNSNLVKGFWRSWAAVSSQVLRAVVLDNLPERLWSHAGADPPAEATRMRSSAQLQLPLETYSSDLQFEPSLQAPSSKLQAPAEEVTSSVTATRAVENTDDDNEFMDQVWDAFVFQRRSMQTTPRSPAWTETVRANAIREHSAEARRLLDTYTALSANQLGTALAGAREQMRYWKRRSAGDAA